MDNRNSTLELICVLPQVYLHSAELQLAQRLFFSALPDNTKITLIDDDAQQNLRLYQAIQCSQAEYIVLAQEPGILISAGGIKKLLQVLQDHLGVTAVLAADLRDQTHQETPPYLSLFGFEQFTQALPEQHKVYDQRIIWLLLGNTVVLQSVLSHASVHEHGTPLDYLRQHSVDLIIATHVFIHAFFDYYQQNRTELLPLIPDHIRSLLDIGCARGEFGAMVKQQYGCRVVGMEYNSTEAEHASQCLDHVFVGDALSQLPDERFDCVSCLDALEHFADAEGLLARIAQYYLNDNGYLLLSLPNVGHWSMVQDLLAGRWDYVPAGILCNTHLRFFTLNTIKTMLNEYGFNIVCINPVCIPMPETFKVFMGQAQQQGVQVNKESLDTLAYHLLAQRQVS